MPLFVHRAGVAVLEDQAHPSRFGSGCRELRILRGEKLAQSSGGRIGAALRAVRGCAYGCHGRGSARHYGTVPERSGRIASQSRRGSWSRPQSRSRTRTRRFGAAPPRAGSRMLRPVWNERLTSGPRRQSYDRNAGLRPACRCASARVARPQSSAGRSSTKIAALRLIASRR
jgi:hypothetical protein